MKKLINKIIPILFVLALFVSSCKKETEQAHQTPNNNNPTDIPANLVKIGETFIIGAQAKAVVYSEKAFFVGYNKIYVAIYDSADNSRLGDGHFDFEPVMTMGVDEHVGPYEIVEETAPSDKLWKGAAVFIMPSSVGPWHLHLHFHNHKNNFEGEGELEVTVADPATPVMRSIMTADSTKLFISLVQPTSPKVGLNNFEVTIHEELHPDTFAPVNDYTVEVNPIMVSMGHGSPNNVNPVFTSEGHYAGTVNFTMSGLWRVNLTLKKNGSVIDNTQYFDIEF